LYFVTLKQQRNINLITHQIKLSFFFLETDLFCQGGLACPWKPRIEGDSVFHTVYRYSYQHNRFWSLQFMSPQIFLKLQNVLLPFKYSPVNLNLLLRQIIWVPVHFHCRKTSRPMSYYAFFERWLLPSLLFGCQNFFTNFALNYFWEP
jgi:hypothetical protein